jgi:predicted ATPase
MIKSVKIQNFKNIRDQSIDLERLTVFVGANSSGKTSVLQAIDLAAQVLASQPEHVFRNERHCDWLYTRGGTGDLVIACTGDNREISVKATPPEDLFSIPGSLGSGAWRFDREPRKGPVHIDAQKSARSIVFLHLDAARLGQPSYSVQEVPAMGPDGSGLASALAHMALNDPDAFEELVGLMQKLIPQIKRLRFRKAVPGALGFGFPTLPQGPIQHAAVAGQYRGEAILFDFANASNVSAETVSEGTMLMLGLLTVLLRPNRPRVVLMDDLEHGLHPLAQVSFLTAIRHVMEKFPDLQILATAHSPYLLNHLEWSEIRLMALGDDGYSVCGRLDNHPQFNRWKDEMAPGELWSLFGEKWIAQRGSAT